MIMSETEENVQAMLEFVHKMVQKMPTADKLRQVKCCAFFKQR